MTTATTTSPLESFQHGRDNFLAAALGAVSGLENSVLEFQHEHERQVRAARAELSETLRDKERLEEQLGEQALELEASRGHVCAVPESVEGLEGFTVGTPAPALEPEPAAAAANNAGSDGDALVIAGLRADLEAEKRASAGLRAELEAEKIVSAGLRAEIDSLDGTLDDVEGKLRSANEAHTRYVRETQETFDQRLSAGVRTAETGVRGEALRIIEAIAADNPTLADVADLFTVAFPAEAPSADGSQDPAPAPGAETAPVPAEDFLANIPAPKLAEAPAAEQAVSDRDEPVTAPVPMTEDFFNALPAPEAAPAPMTQVLLPAPDLSEDAILDPNFFDNPEPLDAPAGEPVQAPAPADSQADVPKPGYGLFGRKKEAQNV